MDEDDIDDALWASIAIVLDDLEDLENTEYESDEDAAAAAAIVGGLVEARLMRNEVRRRRYLTRKELLPNPREQTPWQALYASQSDRAFITTMGFDVAAFRYLLNGGFAHQWDTHPIERVDVDANGRPRLGRRSLDAAGALGLVLHWLSSSMRETSLQEIFALTPATANRYLRTAVDILISTTARLPDAAIRWPSSIAEFEEFSELITAQHPLLVGAFGVVDGLGIAVQVSEDEEVENSTYSGWRHDHVINNVLSFSPKGKLLVSSLLTV